MGALQQLISAGLIVRLFNWRTGFIEFDEIEPLTHPKLSYVIAKPAKEPNNTHHFLGRDIPIDDSVLNLKWNTETSRWELMLWDYIPGPGPTDFTASFATLDEIVPLLIGYYFGQDTPVDSWMVPLNRHPELSYQHVCRAIAEAINVTKNAFEGIAERRRARIWENKLLGETPWEWALQCQFLRILHATDQFRILQLRRDTQEAYIVHSDR